MICLTLLNGMKIHMRACHIVEITEAETGSFVKLSLNSSVVDYQVKECAAEVCEAVCDLEERLD